MRLLLLLHVKPVAAATPAVGSSTSVCCCVLFQHPAGVPCCPEAAPSRPSGAAACQHSLAQAVHAAGPSTTPTTGGPPAPRARSHCQCCLQGDAAAVLVWEGGEGQAGQEGRSKACLGCQIASWRAGHAQQRLVTQSARRLACSPHTHSVFMLSLLCHPAGGCACPLRCGGAGRNAGHTAGNSTAGSTHNDQ